MTECSIKNAIQSSMVAAMKAQEKPRLSVIRLIQAAIKQQEVDQRILLNDEQMLELLAKMIRQRKESIKQFALAKRDDLVQKEAFEITVIQEFLPAPFTQEEIIAFVQDALKTTGALSMQDMSKVMAVLKPKIMGRADLNEVGALLKKYLNN
jgi:uncharacterized protein YqeY